MKLRISSCKRTVFRKDVVRFAPVWGGWLVFLGLILLTMAADGSNYWFPSNLANSLQIMSVFTCGYALLVTQVLFGDLFNSRMCNALHALPLRREHWFDTHISAGQWFCLIPTTVIAAAAALWIHTVSDMENGWQIPLYWWAGTNLSYLFFFGVGVFSAMLVGNRFALAAVYGTVNLASVLVMFLVDSLYVPLIDGMLTPTDPYIRLCPLWYSCTLDYIDCFRKDTGNTYIDAFGIEQQEQISGFTVKPEDWQYLAIIALVGLALLVLSRLIYKRRRLESAGDFAAAPALAPVFQTVLTLIVTACFGLLYELFFGTTGLLSLYVGAGMVIGWFVVKMLICRTTRVFGPKNWPGLLLLGAALALSLFVTKLDPLGLGSWVPKADQVRNVQIFLQNYGEQFTTDLPREIGDMISIHSLLLEDPVTEEEAQESRYSTKAENPVVTLRLTYTLTNGHTAQREYYLRVNSEEGRIAEGYFSDIRAVSHNSSLRGNADKESFLAIAAEPNYINLYQTTLGEEYLTEEFVEALLAAIVADCEAGTMAQSAYFHEEVFGDTIDDYAHYLYLDFGLKNEHWVSVMVFPDSENTLAVLEKTGAIPEFE